MERRKFVIGAGALATGSAAAVGTGAFSSVEANRTVTVNTAGDADAYLGLTGDDDFVDDDSSSSQLTIDLGAPTVSGSGGGEGFNEDAITDVDGVFTITNQGSEDVLVGFEGGDGGGRVLTVDLDNAEVTLKLPGEPGARDLTPGDSADVDVTVDTTESPGSSSSAEITITADPL